MSVVERARDAVVATGAESDRVDAAIGWLSAWADTTEWSWAGPVVEHLVQTGQHEELLDAFSRVLLFGTGGRRGAVGVGPNRMNRWTVARTATAHATWLREAGVEGGVVLGWDCRTFRDLRQRYRGTALLGLSSADLADVAAEVYAAHGISVHVRSEGWLSTPELSHAIRELGAAGGVMFTASHNPPDDNGIKVYGPDGGQLVGPRADALSACDDAVEEVRRAPARRLALSDALLSRWVAAVTQGFGPSALRVRYSPLHGVGRVDQALVAMGCSVDRVRDQEPDDGRFATVPDRSANPEHSAVLRHALEGASGADLVMASDPDGDRLACAVAHRGRFVILDGHAIAVLVTQGALSRRPAMGWVARTRVTTSLVDDVARAAGARVVNDLPVGFKYIAARIEQDPVGFLVGVEESHGGLCTAAVRDKDAASAAASLVHLATQLAPLSLVDHLEALHREHGPAANHTHRVPHRGHEAWCRSRDALARLEADAGPRYGGLEVAEWCREGGALTAVLEPRAGAHRSARVTWRMSGTEPLLKVYAEVRGHAGQPRSSALDEEARRLATAWMARADD